MSTPIDRLYEEHKQLVEFLEQANQPSLIVTVDESFRKSLTLAAASYFEVRTREYVVAYVEEVTQKNVRVVSFAKAKGVERQYHTYFDWKKRKAGPFFALFGGDFKAFIDATIRTDDRLQKSIDAFLELGDLRNMLAHQDYAVFTMEKTVEDIYELYKNALYFTELMPQKLREWPTLATGEESA